MLFTKIHYFFWTACALRIARRAVLEGLGSKNLFIVQPWWETWVLEIYHGYFFKKLATMLQAVKVHNFYSNEYVEYESNDDKNKTFNQRIP